MDYLSDFIYYTDTFVRSRTGKEKINNSSHIDTEKSRTKLIYL